MAATDFTIRALLPALRVSGLLPGEIASHRKVQETVYLLERAGVDLGYIFKWELFGPYSVDLADDLRNLHRETIDNTTAEADPQTHEALERIRTLLDAPEELQLRQEDWLRLVACVDFVERRNPGATENGATPYFVERNFDRAAINAARERLRELLAA